MESCSEDSPFLEEQKRSEDGIHQSTRLRPGRCQTCNHRRYPRALPVVLVLNCVILLLIFLGIIHLLFRGSGTPQTAQCEDPHRFDSQVELNRDIRKMSSYCKWASLPIQVPGRLMAQKAPLTFTSTDL